MREIYLSKTFDILKKLFYIHLVFLVFMTLFRVVFFNYYLELDSFDNYYFDILNAFFLGFRIDFTVVGYIQVLPTFALIALYYIKKDSLYRLFTSFLKYYLFFTYFIVAILLFADFGFYSYFKEHINLLFFGLFEDDTSALMVTFWQNYNVVGLLGSFLAYLIFVFFVIKKILHSNQKDINSFFGLKFTPLIFIILIVFNFLIIRGTIGMYPLGKMIPNVSENTYINKISQNGVRAFISAYGVRKAFVSKKLDYIKLLGFDNRIEDAFKIHKHTENIDTENLLNNITYTSKRIDDKDYNVVVIMVESFGLPILKYQSAEFDIMGSLKKHFDEDVLFTNIISDGDGTINSLESMLLNIPYRPNSFVLAQSSYAQTAFDYTAAFLYNDSEYNTSFIYGGDLTWRDLGNFAKYQGYKNTEGKQDIFKSLNVKENEGDFFHPWGIYDEYLYTHILKKLEASNKKEFIVALSTNNHPPYNIPNDYTSKSLVFSGDLKNHIIGDLSLAQQRFRSYAYALDQVGIFLDKFKESKFKDNTIVVVTADNNTVEGIMKYDDNPIFTSKNIPLYFYLPAKLKEKLEIDTKVAGSHKDIFPTLYNLSLDNKKYFAVGTNLLDKNQIHYGFNGSMIVNSRNEVRKLNSLNEASEDGIINYYKATLAVTEYLLNNYEIKNRVR
ncbi:MAG: sulfatase-like hydrolase/transferase [Aliarcobacter sp.]|nr:sulfatase-like hydrolase/transferase [Aliarcobacter sp.]